MEEFYAINQQFTENPSIDNINKWNILFETYRKKLTAYKNPNIENKKGPTVFLSFTTCKRVELFQETVNSILNHWQDLEKIDYWFCVDDNSSIDDRVTMVRKYPWIDYVFKTSTEKGHRESMNIIWNKLKEMRPTYWIHIEDDFLFYDKMNYVTDSIYFLKQCEENGYPKVSQVLFNRAYGETIECHRIMNHIGLPFTNKIVLHDHKIGQFQYQNCHYWPHYSFRPSMVKVETILELGNYDSPNTFFERDYADRWNASGYQSVFFNKLTNRHIGKLTKETGANAYSLNKEKQFHSEETLSEKKIEKATKTPWVKVINLKRRPDRKTKIEAQLSKNNIEYEIVEAVDGCDLTPSLTLKSLFRDNDFGYRRGVIGCALSHIKLWKQLLEDKMNSHYLIMEDDANLCPHFGEKIQMVDEFINHELLLLGYLMHSEQRMKVSDIYDKPGNPTIHPFNKSLCIGGTHCYSITKMGAYKLLDYISKNGIQNGIDYLMFQRADVTINETRPHLAFAEWSENGEPIDTDIQNRVDFLDFNAMKNLLAQFTFYPKLDHIGDDLYLKKGSLEKMLKIAIQDKSCVGFNTIGYFKHKIDIDGLQSSSYFKETDGLYVKKSL